ARGIQEATHSLGNGVTTLIVPIWPGLPKGRDRDDDQTGVDLMQRGIAQLQTVQIARRKAFDEHIPVGEHTQQQVAPRGGGDIERDTALVRVKSEKKRTGVW